MKFKISLLIMSFLLSMNLIHAQEPEISFSETTHDFGTIGNKDGAVTHDFILTNKSKTPLVISKVTPSCGCTSPSWTKEPIGPGASGKITVTYEPAGAVGAIAKTIQVTTNLNPKNTILYIKAQVVAGNTDQKSNYPVTMGHLLLKANPVLDFGQTELKELKTAKIELYNQSDASIAIADAFSLPPFITVDTEIIPSQKRTVVTFTLHPEELNQLGIVQGKINVTGGTKQVTGTLPYRAFIQGEVEKLTPEQAKERGKIQLSKNQFSFSKSAKKNSVSLKIANSGKSVLNIKGIQTYNPEIKVSKTTLQVQPNEIVDIQINYPVHQLKNPKSPDTIYIISDDPKRPVAEVHVIVQP